MANRKLQIPAHVFGYSLAMIPPLLYGYYYQTNKPNEKDFEEELRKNYSHNIEGSERKRGDMVKFMNALKRGDTDTRMDEVLHAGKGEMKRHHKVDGRFYGTEEGVAAKKRMEEELRNKPKKKKKKKKKGDGKSKKVKSDVNSADTTSTSATKEISAPVVSATTKSVVALGLVGAAAAVVGVFFGGGRAR